MITKPLYNSIPFFLLLFVSGSLFSQEAYKWTDADNRIYYGDRPPEHAENAVPVDLPPQPTDAQKKQAQERLQQQTDMAERYKAQREAQKETEENLSENSSEEDSTSEDEDSNLINNSYCRGPGYKDPLCRKRPPTIQPIPAPKKPVKPGPSPKKPIKPRPL